MIEKGISKRYFIHSIPKINVSAIEDLLKTVAALRNPEGGCPWDIEQTHESLAVCLIDECCELLETLDNKDMEHMREELGDVLLQVVMHAQMAKEEGVFDFSDVASELNDKLIRRHPHVFGEEKGKFDDSGKVLKRWDEIKAAEKKNGPERERKLFKNLPPQLPSLLRARDVYKQISKQDLPVEALGFQ